LREAGSGPVETARFWFIEPSGMLISCDETRCAQTREPVR
jgi:hypothetical protein